jgi:predicted permease
VLAQIFGIIFPVFAIAATGWAYGRWKRPDMTFANQLNMDVFIPALVFHALSSKDFSITAYQHLFYGGLAVVLGAGLLAWPLARLLRLQAKTFVPPMMFCNSGNMGLPLAVFAFGEQALPAAVVLFIIENGLHFTLGTYLMDHRAPLLNVLRMPIVIATLTGLAFSALNIVVPEPLHVAIGMLGQISIALLLFSLGVRLTSMDFRDWRVGVAGAVASPVLGVAAALAALPFLELPPEQRGLLLMFGALPPAVLNYLIAEQYRQEPSRVASIVMLGNLAAFVSIPIVLAFALPR